MPLSRAALPFSFALVGLMNAGPIRASELKPVTAKAFAHYEALTEARMQSEVDDPGGTDCEQHRRGRFGDGLSRRPEGVGPDPHPRTQIRTTR